MRPNFFEQVYRLVKRVPRGRVASYGQIAALLGHPQAARTVGWALASMSSEQAREVPWQRIINSHGRISISRMDLSAELQRQLLEEEGIVFDETEHVDMRVFGWEGLEPPEVAEIMRVV